MRHNVITLGVFVTDNNKQSIFIQGEKPGIVVRAEESRPRGCGFESRRILDGCKQFASYYIKKIKKIKVAKWGTPKRKKIQYFL